MPSRTRPRPSRGGARLLDGLGGRRVGAVAAEGLDVAVSGVLLPQLRADLVGVLAVADLPVDLDQPQPGVACDGGVRVLLADVAEVEDRRVRRLPLHVEAADG